MKKQIKKIIPLAVVYLSIMLLLLADLDYELIITITAAIPLAMYIFTNNQKLKRALRYILLLAALGLGIYLVNTLTRDYHWFLFAQKIYFNETKWAIFRWNGYFIYDLKYFAYLGAVLLAIKWGKNGK